MLCFATQVPLGIILKNQNKGEEMVDIMSDLHQYVPAVEYTTSVTVPVTGKTMLLQHAFHKIFIGADHLLLPELDHLKRLWLILCHHIIAYMA